MPHGNKYFFYKLLQMLEEITTLMLQRPSQSQNAHKQLMKEV